MKNKIIKITIILLVIINIIVVIGLWFIYKYDRLLWENIKLKISGPTYEEITEGKTNYHAKELDLINGYTADIYRYGDYVKVEGYSFELDHHFIEYYNLKTLEYYNKWDTDDIFKQLEFRRDIPSTKILPEYLVVGLNTNKKAVEVIEYFKKLAYVYKLRSIEYPDERPDIIVVDMKTGLPLDYHKGAYTYTYDRIGEIKEEEAKMPDNLEVKTLKEQRKENFLRDIRIDIESGYTEEELYDSYEGLLDIETLKSYIEEVREEMGQK